MGQRARILTEILGFDGWRVKEVYFEGATGERVVPGAGYTMLRETKVVLVVVRRWGRRAVSSPRMNSAAAPIPAM